MSEETQVAAPARSKRASWVREVAETLILTVAIFLVVRLALQNFKVEGESMMPNFHNGEYILVNKADYMVHSPSRGDVIVFQAVPAGQPDRDFIKRIIGLPGDTVQVKQHTIYVNRRPLHEPYIPSSYQATYDFGPQRVPRGDYFVLGDNRNNSYDSAHWTITPWLPRKDIIGKAWFSYWPPAHFGLVPTPSF